MSDATTCDLNEATNGRSLSFAGSRRVDVSTDVDNFNQKSYRKKQRHTRNDGPTDVLIASDEHGAIAARKHVTFFLQ